MRVEWRRETRVLVQRGATYARMIRLRDGTILCSYDRGGQIYVRRSHDEGKTWEGEGLVWACPYGIATNAEVLQLRGGRVLLSLNERPRDGIHPFAINTCASDDGGRTWTPPRTIYGADVRAENGCWEPAQIQLPDGEVQLFFANESPYRKSAEQEITLVRSRDEGATWSAPRTVALRAGHRDGMPVPLVLQGGRGIALAIEDNGLSGAFKPVILHSPLEGSWGEPIGGDSPRRWGALASSLPPEVYAGAPYLCQMPGGETILSCQSTEGGRKPRMVVYVGDRDARGFSRPSVPFEVPPDVSGLWNALFVKDATTVTAISATTIEGVPGVWAVDGRVGPLR